MSISKEVKPAGEYKGLLTLRNTAAPSQGQEQPIGLLGDCLLRKLVPAVLQHF